MKDQSQSQKTNTNKINGNVGYTNNGGYTMPKAEYYKLLEAQGKKIEYTPNGVIIH